MSIQSTGTASYGPTTYGLADLVADMRRVTDATGDPKAVIEGLTGPLRRMALDKSWVRPSFYRGDDEQGNGSILLHEEPDHSLAVYVVAWLPRRGVPPHDHQTWAIVAGVDGPETNVFWERADDGISPGHCTIRESHRRTLGPGDVVAFLPDDIHSVQNESDGMSLSLHIYGKNLSHVARSQFDPATGKIAPFAIKVN
jgi:predicted metal-dependent enzyme (double-stranded beta helix superfamily)